MRTVCDSEFQTDGAENRKARVEKSVNGLSGSGMAAERKVRRQARSFHLLESVAARGLD